MLLYLPIACTRVRKKTTKTLQSKLNENSYNIEMLSKSKKNQSFTVAEIGFRKIQKVADPKFSCQPHRNGICIVSFEGSRKFGETNEKLSEQRQYPTPHSTHIQLILGSVCVTQVTLVRSQQPRFQALWGDEIRDPGNEVEKSALS